MIIVDSREQKPLWKRGEIVVRKIDCGDYATARTEPILVVERKSPGDLYGTILAGHERFRRELMRSLHKDFYVFVECPKSVFVGKQWSGAYRVRGSSAMLASIIETLEEEWDITFVWCANRNDMKRKIREIFDFYEAYLDAIESI